MSDVPRETPPVPEAARGVFSSAALPAVTRYAELLATEGVRRGLIGPREVPRLWERHLINSAALAPALPSGVRVVDVGSGAGLPGLVLAVARPDLEVTLVEPLLRRTTFLDEVVAELAMDNVAVRRSRAEDLHGDVSFDVVTSRAVAPLGRLLEWCMPLVGAGGQVLALKGASASAEVHAVRPLLARRGWAVPEVLLVQPEGVQVLPDPTDHPDQAGREESTAAVPEDPSTVRAVRVRWSGRPQVSLPVGSPRNGARGGSSRSARGRSARGGRR